MVYLSPDVLWYERDGEVDALRMVKSVGHSRVSLGDSVVTSNRLGAAFGLLGGSLGSMLEDNYNHLEEHVTKNKLVSSTVPSSEPELITQIIRFSMVFASREGPT